MVNGHSVIGLDPWYLNAKGCEIKIKYLSSINLECSSDYCKKPVYFCCLLSRKDASVSLTLVCITADIVEKISNWSVMLLRCLLPKGTCP